MGDHPSLINNMTGQVSKVVVTIKAYMVANIRDTPGDLKRS